MLPRRQKSEKRKKHPQEEVVRDLIINALMNQKYKARTISGVSKEAHLPKSTVINALKKDGALAVSLKVYPYRSKDGKLLITTKERFSKESTFKEKFIDFFSTKRQDLKNIAEKEAED